MPGIADTEISRAQDPQCCSGAQQAASHNTVWKGQWWKWARVLLTPEESLEQTVASGRRETLTLGWTWGPANKRNVRKSSVLVLEKQTF